MFGRHREALKLIRGNLDMYLLQFLQVLINTLLISLYKITILFPIPIVIALMLNEVRRMFFKRTKDQFKRRIEQYSEKINQN